MKGWSIISVLSLVMCITTNAQEADLRFATQLDCAKAQYCATIEMRSSNDFGFGLGTSSIFFTYNARAVKFKSYKSLNFDEQNKCILDQFSPYSNHQYDGVSPGKFNTTITLDIVEAACPNVGPEYIPVAEVCFDILDPAKKVNLKFSEKHTHLDLAEEQIQMVEKLNFKNKNQRLTCNDLRPEELFTNSLVMSLSHNPVEKFVNLNILSKEDDVFTLGLYDLTGKLVLEKKVEVFKEIHSVVRLDMEELLPGVYLLKNLNNPYTNELKIVKQ